jgi:hypothetical protein
VGWVILTTDHVKRPPDHFSTDPTVPIPFISFFRKGKNTNDLLVDPAGGVGVLFWSGEDGPKKYYFPNGQVSSEGTLVDGRTGRVGGGTYYVRMGPCATRRELASVSSWTAPGGSYDAEEHLPRRYPYEPEQERTAPLPAGMNPRMVRSWPGSRRLCGRTSKHGEQLYEMSYARTGAFKRSEWSPQGRRWKEGRGYPDTPRTVRDRQCHCDMAARGALRSRSDHQPHRWRAAEAGPWKPELLSQARQG